MRCDLHVHSNCSDGSCTPEEIAETSAEAGLSAVALCDHNTVAGLIRFSDAAKKTGLIPVNGVEISCGYMDEEVHILGLFIPKERFRDVSEYLLEINIRKVESNEHLMKNLTDAGYSIDYKSVLDMADGAIPNRVHFANVLMNAGYVSSISEAFATVLSDEKGLYVPTRKLDSFDVIRFLESISAVPVMAHPFLSLTESELLEFLPSAKKFGLAGMECLYSTYSKEETAKAFELAKKFGLLPSGGSDFHGTNKPDIKIGEGKGNLRIPMEYYERLKLLSEKS